MTHMPLKMSVLLVALTFAVPVFAHHPTESSASSRMMQKTVDASCMSAAVSKRDVAISTALQTVVTALQTRGTSLSTAWNGTEKVQIKADIKAANTAFAGTWRAFDKIRKAAWAQYAVDAKACKVSSVDAGSASLTTGGL